MAHKALVGGVTYDVAAGKSLIGGAAYGIKAGKTLVNGVGYDVPFSKGIPISDLAVGGSVFLNVNGTPTEFLVVHKGLPSSIYDASCDGVWLLMKDCYEARQWHSSDNNNYKASTIHTYLNGTFLNLFDADIKAQIKTVKIPYVNGNGNSAVASGSSGLSTQIFLLSGYEVGWTKSMNEYIPADGAKLDYFESGNTYGGTNNSKRIGYLDGSAIFWWLRSPQGHSTQYSKYPWAVLTDGGWGNYQNCTNKHGIRPALILPHDILVDENFNVIAA